MAACVVGRRDQRLDLVQARRIDRAAKLVAHLEAAVLGRVVAGRDVDGGHRVHGADAEADDRRGRGRVGEEDLEAVAGQHFGRGGREMFGQKAPIMADDDIAGPAVGHEVIGIALGAAAHIGKGVVFGNACAPTVGAELDVVHGTLLCAVFRRGAESAKGVVTASTCPRPPAWNRVREARKGCPRGCRLSISA